MPLVGAARILFSRMEAFVKANAVVRVRRRWLPIAGPVASGGAVIATAALMGPDVVFILLAAVASFMAVHGAWRRWPIVLRGTLRADSSGVTIGRGALGMRVGSGRVESRGARTVVRFDRYLSGVEVDVTTVGEGVLLLSALGIPARHARLVDEVAHPEDPPVGALVTFGRLRRLLPGTDDPYEARDPNAFSFVHGSILGFFPRILFVLVAGIVGPFLVFLYTPAGLWLATPVAVTLFALGLLRSTLRIQVGADGLQVHRLLSPPRFVPYASITRVLHDHGDVAIETEGRWLTFHDDRRLVEEVERFVSLVTAHRERLAEREPVDPTAFTRAGRELGEWMNAVTGAMEANASFRTQAVPAETLWRIVEDGAAPATARAGAALAIRPTLDADGRARLRVLAEGSADPRLRVALATLSVEDDDAIEGVLARVADRA